MLLAHAHQKLGRLGCGLVKVERIVESVFLSAARPRRHFDDVRPFSCFLQQLCAMGADRRVTVYAARKRLAAVVN